MYFINIQRSVAAGTHTHTQSRINGEHCIIHSNSDSAYFTLFVHGSVASTSSPCRHPIHPSAVSRALAEKRSIDPFTRGTAALRDTTLLINVPSENTFLRPAPPPSPYSFSLLITNNDQLTIISFPLIRLSAEWIARRQQEFFTCTPSRHVTRGDVFPRRRRRRRRRRHARRIGKNFRVIRTARHRTQANRSAEDRRRVTCRTRRHADRTGWRYHRGSGGQALDLRATARSRSPRNTTKRCVRSTRLCVAVVAFDTTRATTAFLDKWSTRDDLGGLRERKQSDGGKRRIYLKAIRFGNVFRSSKIYRGWRVCGALVTRSRGMEKDAEKRCVTAIRRDPRVMCNGDLHSPHIQVDVPFFRITRRFVQIFFVIAH